MSGTFSDSYENFGDDAVGCGGGFGILNLLTGRTKVTECTAFLTSKRFVATKKRQFFPWGPLIWLFIVLMKRKIVFQIQLASFAAIQYDKGATREAVVAARGVARRPSGQRSLKQSDETRGSGLLVV